MKEKFSNNKKEYQSIWGEDAQTSSSQKDAQINDKEIVEYFYSHNENTEYVRPESNTMALILTFISAIIFVAGFAIGIAWTYEAFFTWPSFIEMFIIWCVSFVVGMMFLGFAEIIKLLNDIKNKIK